MSIPAMQSNGVLPPFVGSSPARPAGHGPYACDMAGVVRHLGTSARRVEILKGCLGFRKALRDLGMISGFQWLDGSFVENPGREPGDIDVVTFFDAPQDRQLGWMAADPDLFRPAETKTKYLVDAYYVGSLGQPWTESLLSRGNYWKDLFGHRRGTLEWKGFLRVSLPQADEDDEAQVMLDDWKEDE